MSDLLEHAGNIEDRLVEYDRAIGEIAREDERSRRLMQLRGIGPTTASALIASMGAGHDFRNGRQVAAWLGLTPGQYSGGGKERLGSITKAGNAYLRSLLVLGARAVMASLGDKQDRFSRLVRNLVERRGYWRAAVAIAAKNARMAWTILKYGDTLRHELAKPASVRTLGGNIDHSLERHGGNHERIEKITLHCHRGCEAGWTRAGYA